MNYVKNFNLLGVEARQRPSLVGNGSPTLSTVGVVGEFYLDESTGDLYKCIAVENDSYTWDLIGGGDSSLNEKVSELENRISANEEHTNLVEEETVAITNYIIGINEKVNKMESDIGDINSALDELHNYAQAFISGGA